MNAARVQARMVLALAALHGLTACQQPSGRLQQGNLPACAKPAGPKAQVQVDRSFLIFFDRNSDKLTDRAKIILNEFAAAWRREEMYGAVIKGHTDTSETGPKGNNVGQRRAEAARIFLLQTGLPEQELKTLDLAATRPLVETGPNKPEPQNRFVDFTYRDRGTDKAAAARAECWYWMRFSMCGALASKDDQSACENAVGSLQY